MIVTRQSLAPLLREQRKSARLSRAKVGRACGLSEATIEALEKGASGFLCKPFTERQLNDALVKLIES